MITNTAKNDAQRQALENSLQIKQEQRKRYTLEAERLEARADQCRLIADELSRGIERTRAAIERLGQGEDYQDSKRQFEHHTLDIGIPD